MWNAQETPLIDFEDEKCMFQRWAEHLETLNVYKNQSLSHSDHTHRAGQHPEHLNIYMNRSLSHSDIYMK